MSNLHARQAVRDFLPVLEGWFGSEIAEIGSNPPWRGRGLLMGCPVWGAKYLDRFEKFCLPSILGEHNKAALQGLCRIVLFTDTKSYARLWNLIKPLEREGFDILVRIIPAEVMEQATLDPYNKYWILGVAQNTLIQMAARAGMAFHMLMPDHVYAQTYFLNLFRLAARYDGIAQTGISADVSCAEEFERFRQPDGSLSIPDADLGDIGWRHLHKQTRASLMNGMEPATRLPKSHLLAWQGRDKLHLYCCHMNMAYLSASMCEIAPTRIPATIDAELPAFMPVDFYVPKAGDSMTFIEVSDDTKGHSTGFLDFKEFASECWIKVRFGDDYQPYFKAVCEVPIHPQQTFLEDAEIQRQHADIMARLAEARPTAAIEFVQGLVKR